MQPVLCGSLVQFPHVRSLYAAVVSTTHTHCVRGYRALTYHALIGVRHNGVQARVQQELGCAVFGRQSGHACVTQTTLGLG